MEGLRETLLSSPEEFLVWAEGQEEKHEFVDGVVVMQAGASRNHERVAKRIFASLFRQVDDGQFDVNKGDFGVRIKDGHGRGSVLLPDVLVDLQSEHGDERATTTPIVVIEVLSPSTEAFDRGDKFTRYQTIESLTDYVLVASEEMGVEHFARQADGSWSPALVVEAGTSSYHYTPAP